MPNDAIASNVPLLKIFVSHSSADVDFVRPLVELLRSALPLTAADIRCTSVAGYRLEGGDETMTRLRNEIDRTLVFVAVITPASLSSHYAMFEIGARWGSRRRLIPLVALGQSLSGLPSPLSALNAIDARDEASLTDLLFQVGQALGLESEKPSVYLTQLKALAVVAASTRQSESASDGPAISDSFGTRQLTLEEEGIVQLLAACSEMEGMIEEELLGKSGLPGPKCKYYIRRLQDSGLIDSRYNMFPDRYPTRHRLSQEGMSLAIGRGWI